MLAHVFDDTGAFVAEDARRREGQRAVDHREVGVTDAAGADVHDDVARSRLRRVHLLDHQRLVETHEDGCPHCSP